MTSTVGSARRGIRCDLPRGESHLRAVGCDDCSVRELCRKSLRGMEEMYRQGYVRQAVYEAYMHMWAADTPRFSSLANGWLDEPTDPEVVALVALFREILTERK